MISTSLSSSASTCSLLCAADVCTDDVILSVSLLSVSVSLSVSVFLCVSLSFLSLFLTGDCIEADVTASGDDVDDDINGVADVVCVVSGSVVAAVDVVA